MRNDHKKPKNVPITDALRSAIKASQGILSLREAAKQFGVSGRTVGRIYHGSELSQARKSVDAQEVATLREEVTKLTEMVQDLCKQVQDLKGQQRLRQPLNPALHIKPHRSHETHYSSPYRESPGTQLVKVYGSEVQPPHDYDKVALEGWFIAKHPVSPECAKFPYPQPVVKAIRAHETEPAPAVVFRDPPAGQSCACDDCKSWRLSLAYEFLLLDVAFPRAMGQYYVFHQSKYRA
jgi:DNA-binding transcriptional regulator YhcF (GntR family)